MKTKYPYLIALIGTACIAALMVRIFGFVPNSGTSGDFMVYWSAAQLVRTGGDPYNVSQILQMEQQNGWNSATPEAFRYPPWSIPLFLPFTCLSLAAASRIWLVLMTFLFAASCYYMFQFYLPNNSYRWLFLMGALLYFPILDSLHWGTFSAFLLAALTAFLYAQQHHQDWLAGVCLAVLAIKPHLFIIFGFVVLVWIVRAKRWAVLGGALLAVTAGTAVTLLLGNIESFSIIFSYQQVDSVTSTFVNWLCHTLQIENRSFYKYIPLALALPASAIWLFRKSTPFTWRDDLPLVLLVSVLSAPFCWVHDWVMFVPALLHIFWLQQHDKKIYQYIIVTILLISQAIIFWQAFFGDYYDLIWFPIFLMILYLVVYAKSRKSASHLGAGAATSADS